MGSRIQKELEELVRQAVISEETAQRIGDYYQTKEGRSPNRLLLVFGILGALLTGLGIILIVAHNWDTLPKSVKLVLACVPMLIGQLACMVTLRKSGGPAWREASAVFLTTGIAAAIAIVAQVYNLHGNLSDFLLTWMLLTLPIVYVMRSGVTSLIALAGITWYACEVSYFHQPQISWLYWTMLLALIPFYWSLRSTNPNSFSFHSWLIAISVIITLGMFGESEGVWMFVGYMSLFSLLIMIGYGDIYITRKLINNGFLILGSLGTVTVLLILSFRDLWNSIHHQAAYTDGPVVTITMVLLTLVLLVREGTQKGWSHVNPKAFSFLVFVVIFVVGIWTPVTSQVLVNLLLFLIAVITIREGAQRQQLMLLNYGLLIITALIICRFFDTQLSFVIRGLIFILVGLSFFGVNYWMVRKRNNTHAS